MEKLEVRPRVYEDAVSAIRQYITREQLRPGDALPPEREMQQRLGISRNSVREALRVLEMMGLIEAQHGRGLFVKALDLQPLVDALVGHLDLIDESAFHDLLEMRRVLEIGAAELATTNRDEDDLTAMKASLEATRRSIEEGESPISEDLRFHILLTRSAHSPLVDRMYSAIAPFLIEIRRRSPRSPIDRVELLEQHTELCRAIEQRDAEHAMRAMRRHLDGVEAQVAPTSGD